MVENKKNKRNQNSEPLEAIAKEKFKNLINDDLKAELEENIRSLADRVIEEVLHDSTLVQKMESRSLNNNYQEYTKGHQRQKTGGQFEKVFIPRNSLLTDLLQVSHIRTIYHIFIVILILLFLNTIIYDLVDHGRINLGLDLIILGFGKIDVTICIWIVMQFFAFTPYVLVKIWHKCRSSESKNKYQILDILALLLIIAYYITLLIFAISSTLKYKLPVASSLIVLMEMVRFMMKSHAYIRSVSPRVLNSKTSSSIALPEFSLYLYFLFAPTLIYKDSYPRTNKVHWGSVMARLLEVTAVIFYMNFLCERFLVYSWSEFGSQTQILEAKQIVLTIFGSMLPALLTFLCGFYLLLHSWHNASAEILTFADRRFYMDWWNQIDYGGYYRTWNMIVHDWLYTYIYRDINMLFGNRTIGAFFVFLISAIFHEVILTFAFGFFYPVLLLMFGGIGVLLMIITKHANPMIGNIFMWLTLAVGNGLLWSLYSAEYFARQNCPKTIGNDYLDLMVPRSWFCHKIVLSPDWKFQNPFEYNAD